MAYKKVRQIHPLSALRATSPRQKHKTTRHIERKRNIPRLKWGVYARQFFSGILHFVQNDV